MHYDEIGEGEPLLITTGWARAERAFVAHRDLLARSYRCIRHDHRHIGLTIAADAPTQISDLADDLAELLERLEIPSARVLGGGGMGAIVALELAIRHPGKVSALHLGSPCLKADPFLVSLMGIWTRLRALDPVLWAEEVTHWCYTPETFATRGDLVQGGMRARAQEETFSHGNGFARLVQAYSTFDVTDSVGKIRCPVQISNGGELDLITGPRMARQVHAAIPHSELVLFEESSHNYFTEDGDRFGKMLIEFFASV
ncbi:alpha/beta hydrolase [Corticibacterium sp. UT-5YL-CI-8]|nr:alpha/beta hydrolase [Tianweitania sp. UT-5YL-CI-8]